MHDTDRDGLAADGAAAALRLGLLRREPDVALAVAVEMVLSLFREELDGTDT